MLSLAMVILVRSRAIWSNMDIFLLCHFQGKLRSDFLQIFITLLSPWGSNEELKLHLEMENSDFFWFLSSTK